MKIASITIARGGSQRLPGKNMYLFAGRPLVAHKVWQLSRCRLIDEVIVGSDSHEILSAAKAQGATTLERAAEFCDEESRPWNDVIVDMASRIEADIIVWAHCTNPCIRPETYDRAIEAFQSLGKAGDSLVGVTEVRNHFWSHQGVPLNYRPYFLNRQVAEPHRVAADVNPLYFQNGGLFIARREDMIAWRYVFGPRAKTFRIDAGEATDIDTREDMERAMTVYAAQQRPRMVASA